MGKRKVAPKVEKEIVKEEISDTIKFIKDFQGQFNNRRFNAKKGDTIKVLPFEAEWLKKFGAVE